MRGKSKSKCKSKGKCKCKWRYLRDEEVARGTPTRRPWATRTRAHLHAHAVRPLPRPLSAPIINKIPINYQPMITCGGSPSRSPARSLRRQSSINYQSAINQLSINYHSIIIDYQSHQPIINCSGSPGRWSASSSRRFTCRALLPPLLRLLRRQPHPLRHLSEGGRITHRRIGGDAAVSLRRGVGR